MLGRWTELARAASAQSSDPGWQRLSACVSDVIALQAVTMALDELPTADPATQALGLDRAGVLIDRSLAGIDRAWRDELRPESLRALIDDARSAHATALRSYASRVNPTAPRESDDPTAGKLDA